MSIWNRILPFLQLILVSLWCSRGTTSQNHLNEYNEIAMHKGMVITAENKNGIITIEAKDTLERIYKWNGETVSVAMIPREQRWDGSLGIYSPGGRKIHTVVEEGQQHFYSLEDATDWLLWQNGRMDYATNSTGLVVGWYVTGKTKTALSVQVWQFYIQGRKPKDFPTSERKSVTVSFQSGAVNTFPSVGDFDPSPPKTIDGRIYSGKSINIMAEKGINVQDVEQCITNGEKRPKDGYIFYYSKESKFMWVMLEESGRVVLVGK